MKKTLSLLGLGVIALGTSVSYAASLDLGQVFNQDHGFGYTVNQNVTVEGFQQEENAEPHFMLKTQILKDSKDSAVGEYYVLLGEQPMNEYIAGENAEELRRDLVELPAYTTMDIEGEVELKIKQDMITPEKSYHGIVVPVDDNLFYGKHSKEFCFNFSTQKYAEGDECKNFDLPEGVKVASNDENNAVTENTMEEEVGEDIEHNAAGADMRLADISHSVNGNVITLTWTAVPNSENVEIKLYNNTSKDYETIATVPMSQEKYEYTYNNDTQEFIFAFIPRDSKGKEIRYDVNVRHETEETPKIEEIPATGPVENMLVIGAITLLLYAGYRMKSTNETR